MQNDNLFEQESIRKTYWTMALPVTLGMVLSVVYNVVDTYFIARTQDTNLVAAVSLCAPIFSLLMAFGNIFGQGGTSLTSRLFGKKDLEGVKHVSSFCFYMALATGLFRTVVMLLFHDPFLRLLGANDDTWHDAYLYYMTMVSGAPLIVVNFVHMNLLRAEGLSKEAMLGTVSGIAVNILLDPLFISGFGWGAFGAALASVIGYLFSSSLLLIIVLRKSRILSVNPKLAKVSGRDALQVESAGLGAVGNLVVQVTNGETGVVTQRFPGMGKLILRRTFERIILRLYGNGRRGHRGLLTGLHDPRDRRMFRGLYSGLSIAGSAVSLRVYRLGLLVGLDKSRRGGFLCRLYSSPSVSSAAVGLDVLLAGLDNGRSRSPPTCLCSRLCVACSAVSDDLVGVRHILYLLNQFDTLYRELIPVCPMP